MPTLSFSQNTSKILITSEQLKTANIIFVEHKNLKTQLPLLKLKISNLEKINESWKHTDSIKNIKIYDKECIIKDKDEELNSLNKLLKNKKKIIRYGFIGSALITVICLTMK